MVLMIPQEPLENIPKSSQNFFMYENTTDLKGNELD